MALLWLLLRSGSRPTRLAYPCQQAALGSATALVGVPIVAACLRIRRWLTTFLRNRRRSAALVLATLPALAVFALPAFRPAFDPDLADPPNGYRPQVFRVENVRGIEPGRYGGVDDLITLMGHRGLKWHQSTEASMTSGPNGMIAANDVVLIKINAQWSQRGGTNTDVLRGVIRRIVEHPDGFVGEIIVADNGQGWGNLDRTENNAVDHHQSPQDVVNDFAAENWQISAQRWDPLRQTSVAEYSTGDMTSGYVVSSVPDPDTQIKVSYPKFQTSFGTYVSYKYGVWSPATTTYDADRLVVINMPVLKTHATYAITASVKNHMGVVTQSLGTSSHTSVGLGGLGSLLAEVRMPDITILDCVWILAHPGSGPLASYTAASLRKELLAGADPVALDVWAVKHVMIPQIIANGYTYQDYHDYQDPDNPAGVFRTYLDRSMSEMVLGGITTTNDADAVELCRWAGDLDRDGDVDLLDSAELVSCLTGPGASVGPGCESADLDADGDVDVIDFSAMQLSFTGSL